jgi:hypothetical protein
MPKYICEINASSWFYYKEIYYDARSHERRIHKYARAHRFLTSRGHKFQRFKNKVLKNKETYLSRILSRYLNNLGHYMRIEFTYKYHLILLM